MTNKYKVIGDKLHQYYTVIAASSQEEAWDIAAERSDISWFEIETDNTIEPYEVELEEDTLDLIEDDFPLMESGVIVSSDKSDI